MRNCRPRLRIEYWIGLVKTHVLELGECMAYQLLLALLSWASFWLMPAPRVTPCLLGFWNYLPVDIQLCSRCNLCGTSDSIFRSSMLKNVWIVSGLAFTPGKRFFFTWKTFICCQFPLNLLPVVKSFPLPGGSDFEKANTHDQQDWPSNQLPFIVILTFGLLRHLVHSILVLTMLHWRDLDRSSFLWHRYFGARMSGSQSSCGHHTSC